MNRLLISALIPVLGAPGAMAHETSAAHAHEAAPAVRQFKFEPEKKGPIKAPAPIQQLTPVSGQGFWKFTAARELMPIPAEVEGKLVPAHGTVVSDREHDLVYWGLKKVGWIGFSNGLSESWVIPGDDAFAHHNLHGADLLSRRGQRPLVAAADNEGYKIYLTDTSFQNARTLGAPTDGPYATNQTYRPTDVAFVNHERLFVTDGYARGYFMPVNTELLAHAGGFFGGPEYSKTPHGITFDRKGGQLLVSARPEGRLNRWSIAKARLVETGALPEGTLLCDVDVWGDYALAACLDGPNKTPGPLMILNLKKRTIASIIKPKEELGYAFCAHIHDACWHVRKNGRTTEVYLVFTSYDPGGIGALKLVNAPD